MSVSKIAKIKKAPKLIKKKKLPRSKKTLRPKVQAKSKESAVLLSTEISGTSITHGHTSYHHPIIEHKTKKIDDKSQRLIMYVGVSLIMTVIVVVWILNLKHTLGPNAFSIMPASTENSATATDFEALKTNLTKSLDQVKGEIKDLEDLSKTGVTATATPELITSTATPQLPNTLPK